MTTELRYAIRRLLGAPGFTATAALSLALAIGAGAAAFSLIDAVRFRALPFPDGDRLVVVSETVAEDRGGPSPCPGACDVSYTTFADVLERHPFRTVDLVAGYTSGGKALNLGGEPILVTGGVVSPNLFRLLGAEPALGRTLRDEDNRLGAELAVVIGHELWANYLGRKPDIVGQVIQLSDSRYTVVGVMPPGFEHEAGNRFWLPAVPTLDPSTRPSIRSLTVIARLVPGATVAQFAAELGAIDPALLRSARGTERVQRVLGAAPLRTRYTAATQSHDLIFAAVVGCVLLIAGANLANMVLVRALHQRREFAVRAALGAGRGRLVRQLLAEQAVIVTMATLLGLGFAAWLLDALGQVQVLQSLRPTGMESRIDARVVGFAVALAGLFAVGLSLIPARLAARADLQSVLRQSGSQLAGGRWGSRAQRVFVVAQIGIAVVLATGAGLMAKTVVRLTRLDLGFDAGRLIDGSPSFPHPWRVPEKFIPVTRQIATELAAVPGVERVTIRAPAPLAARGAAPRIRLAESAEPLGPALAPAAGVAIDTGYFRTVGVPLVAGRPFGAEDTETGPPVAIVNEWAARAWWPGRDPIGQVIRIDTAPDRPVTLQVVGVARDNRAAAPNLLLADAGPELYRPLAQAPSAFPTFVVRGAGSPAGLLKPVKDVLVRLVPDRPLFATPVAERADQQLAGVRVTAYQILGFAVVGLLLAVIGVYGVLSYAVGRRTQEIGIRNALGAEPDRIRRLVLRDTAMLGAIGVGLGLPAAAAAGGWLGDLLHGTSPRDPVVLGVVAVATLAVAVVAGYLPARRAARVDPLVALRAE